MTKKAAKSVGGQKRATTNHVVIGEKLRAARLRNGMSQSELGKLLGVTFQQIQKYERGANRVDFNRMIEIAKHLNVDLEYFTEPLTVKRNQGMAEFDKVLATREGVQIIEAMVEMNIPVRQLIVDIARKLSEVLAA
jgi:transcriptional regulator with XRE-family HTH domain